jgi:hypothetical protein
VIVRTPPAFPLISLRQASVTKVGIVFVILAAVALKTEDLKIIDRICASFATGDDMINWSGPSSAVAPQALQCRSRLRTWYRILPGTGSSSIIRWSQILIPRSTMNFWINESHSSQIDARSCNESLSTSRRTTPLASEITLLFLRTGSGRWSLPPANRIRKRLSWLEDWKTYDQNSNWRADVRDSFFRLFHSSSRAVDG